MNAFHPLYVQTHMPEFLSTIRTESSQYQHGVVNGAKSRATRESTQGKNVNTINVFPKTKARVSLLAANKD